MNLLLQDKARGYQIPPYLKYFRLAQSSKNLISIKLYRLLLKIFCRLYCVELQPSTRIGGGLYIGHPYGITINPKAIIGRNCNIHKGVTIGKENRGRREGYPIIGDRVWIGVNATVVGKIAIGDDVLIAPNAYVNCDVPSHSIVLGNPCIIKHKENATERYVENLV